MAIADFDGIAIHCAQNSPLCASGKPELLPDEPGGYTGFKALFGNKYVAAGNLTGGLGQGPRRQSVPIQTATAIPASQASIRRGPEPRLCRARCSRPACRWSMPISQTRTTITFSRASRSTFGPGEAGYVQQLTAYNAAFGKFFDRLAQDGITKDNTLFVVTADENDHFVGGPPRPCRLRRHQRPRAPIREERRGRRRSEPGLSSSSSAIPPPSPCTATTRRPSTSTATRPRPTRCHADAGARGRRADRLRRRRRAERQRQSGDAGARRSGRAGPAAHGHARSRRTPNFILFANPDYFLFAATAILACCTRRRRARAASWSNRASPGTMAISRTTSRKTWLGIVGPGVEHKARLDDLFTDHTDIRPTILRLRAPTITPMTAGFCSRC